MSVPLEGIVKAPNAFNQEIIYEAFGDASTGAAGTFYGFVLIPEHHLETVYDGVSDIKVRYGGTSVSRIHCRELLNESRRERSEWAHLKLSDVTEMCGAVLSILRTYEARYVLGVMTVENCPTSFRLRGKNGHADLVHPVNDKWRELWTYYRAATLLKPVELVRPPDPLTTPTPKNMPTWRVVAPLVEPGFSVRKVHLDREQTKIRWFSKKLQWATVASDFVLKAPEGESFLPIQPTKETKHYMLDVADIFVWNVARAFSDKPITFLTEQTDVKVVLCAPMGDQIVLG